MRHRKTPYFTTARFDSVRGLEFSAAFNMADANY